MPTHAKLSPRSKLNLWPDSAELEFDGRACQGRRAALSSRITTVPFNYFSPSGARTRRRRRRIQRERETETRTNFLDRKLRHTFHPFLPSFSRLITTLVPKSSFARVRIQAAGHAGLILGSPVGDEFDSDAVFSRRVRRKVADERERLAVALLSLAETAFEHVARLETE